MRSTAIWALLGFAEVIAAASVPKGFEHLTVRRADEHAASMRKREIRLQRHQRQLEAYSRNTMDPTMMENHASVLDAAKEMEISALRRRADASSGGSAPMDDLYSAGVDIGYSANVSVGTPGQVFTMVPDTGSADLWIPGSTSDDPGHNKFTTSSSSTFQSTSQKFSDSYGLGAASGNVGRDSVQFAALQCRTRLSVSPQHWTLSSSSSSTTVSSECHHRSYPTCPPTPSLRT